MCSTQQCVFLLLVAFIAGVKPGSALCNNTLGLENGNITDSQLTASGSYSSHTPEKARLHSGTGWTGLNNDKQYLQVDLLSLHEITSIAIQGITNGWYTRLYRLYYSLDGIQWESYNTARSTDPWGEALTANVNYRDVVTQHLVPSIKARYLSINPVAYTGYPSLRIELYGCVSTDPIITQRTNVAAEIEESVTWIPSQSPYVIDQETHIRPSANLTIQAGVNVVFTNKDAALIVHGSLRVEGIEGLPSRFTSSTPTPFLQWKGISLMSGGELSLNSVHIRHADQGVTVSNLDDFRVNKSVIYSCGVGLAIKKGSKNETRVAIQDVTLSYNNYGARVHGSTDSPYINIDSCKISDNKQHGIYINNWDNSPSQNLNTEILIKNSVINASQDGISLYRMPGTLYVSNCTFLRQRRYGLSVSQYYGDRYKVDSVVTSSQFERNAYAALYLKMYCKDQTVTIKENYFKQNNREDVYINCIQHEHGIWYLNFSNNTMKERQGSYQSLRLNLNVPVMANIVNNTFINVPNSLHIISGDKNYNPDLSIRHNLFTEITNKYVVNSRKLKIEFTNNTIVNCSAEEGVLVSKFFDHEIHNNKFLNASKNNHDVVLGHYSDADNTTIYKIDLSRNFWSSSDPSIIRSRIRDIFSDAKKGYAVISPYYINKDMDVTSDVDVTDWSDSNGYIGGVVVADVTISANRNLTATKTIIVPENITLKIEKKVSISFGADIGVIIQGRLEVNGIETDPVALAGKQFPQTKTEKWEGLIIDNGDLITSYTTISNASKCIRMIGSQSQVQLQYSNISFCTTAIHGFLLNNKSLILHNSVIIDNDNGLSLNTKLNSTPGLELFGSTIARNRYYGLRLESTAYYESPYLLNITISNCTFSSEILFLTCPTTLIGSVTHSHFKTKIGGNTDKSLQVQGRYVDADITNNTFEEESGLLQVSFCTIGTHIKSGLAKRLHIGNNVFKRTRNIRSIHIDSGYASRGIEEHYINISHNVFTSLQIPVYQQYMLNYHSQFTMHILHINDNVFTMFTKPRTYAVYVQRVAGSVSFMNNKLSGGSQALYLRIDNNPTNESIISNNTFDSFAGYYDLNNDQILYLHYISDTLLQVKENLFIGNNQTVVLLKAPDVIFYGNSFENPNAQYNIKFDSTYYQTAVVNASYNYWGTTNSKTISQKIYDQSYQSNLAQILYVPYLGSWNISDVQKVTSSFVDEMGQIGGAVNGNVTLTIEGSPYTAISNIEVKQTDVLIVQAGVRIYFLENVGITVIGSLLILGNSTNEVEMVSKIVGKKWRGVEFTPEYDNSGVVDIRLVGGASDNEGRVEVYNAGQWGTVCDDSFGNNEAMVVCRMLGYDPTGGVQYFSSAHFGQGTGQIWLDDLGCNGQETHLRQCGSPGWGVSNCGHNEDVGVRCEGVHRISKRQAADNSNASPRELMARQSENDFTVLILEWKSPLVPVSELTGYEVTANNTQSGNSFSFVVAPNVTSATITGLTPNTVYSLTVKAIYSNASAGQADVLMFRTAKGPKPYTILRHIMINDTSDGLTIRGNVLEVVGVKSFYSVGAGMTVDFNSLTPIKYLDISDVILAHNTQFGLLIESETYREESNLFLKDSSIYDNSIDGIRVNGDVNVSVEQSAFFNNLNAIRVLKTVSGSIKMYNSHFFKNSEQVVSINSGGTSRQHYDIEMISCNIREHNTKRYDWRHNLWPLVYMHVSGVPKISILISNNIITDNIADGFHISYGGSMVHKTDIVNNFFTNNSNFVWLNAGNGYTKGNITLDQNSVSNCIVQYSNYPLMNFRIGQSHLVIKNFTTIFNNTANNIIEISELLKDKSKVEIFGNDIRNNTAINTINLLTAKNVSIHHNILNNSVQCELAVVDFVEGVSINALHNYWGYPRLLNVIPRVCGFDRDMGKVKVKYIPYLEELTFFPKFNAYVSPGNQEDFYIGNIMGGEVSHSLVLTARTEPYIVDRSIFIRPGGKLVMDRNVTVLFKKDRGIYVRGSLVLNGEQDEEIKLLPHDKSPWYGIILNSYNSFNFYGMYDPKPQTSLIFVDSTSFKSELVTKENDVSVTFHCYAHSTPEVKYKWEKKATNGSILLLTESDRYKFTQGTGLTVSGPTVELDEGSYRCSPYNDAGFVLGRWMSLAFARSGEFSNVQPVPVYARAYEGAMLECPLITLTHPEAYEFRWKKNTEFIQQESNNIFISTSGNLYFSEVTVQDAGQYACVLLVNNGRSGMGEFMSSSGTNSDTTFEKSSQPITLTVMDNVATPANPPLIHDRFPKQSPNRPIFETETIVLECFAYGTLPLEYVWTVPSGANSKRSFGDSFEPQVPWEYERHWLSDNNRVLRISNARMSDAGVYNCTVNGRHSSDYHTVQVIIQEKLKIVQQFDNRKLQPNTDTMWICNVTGVDNPIYKWYHDGQPLVSSTEEGIEVNNNILTITKLNAARHNGIYQCVVTDNIHVVSTHALLTVFVYGPLITGIRLVGKNSSNSGRVEIEHAGVYGRIVDNSITTADSSVICRMLGFDPAGGVSTFYISLPTQERNKKPIWLQSLNCHTNAISLEQCDAEAKWGKISERGLRDVGVTCLGTYTGGHNESDTILNRVVVNNSTEGVAVRSNIIKFSKCLINNTSKTGISVSSGAHSLDLNGTSVINSGQKGIEFNNIHTINVRNVTVENSSMEGIRIAAGKGNVLVSNVVIRNCDKGIYVPQPTAESNNTFTIENSRIVNSSSQALHIEMTNYNLQRRINVINNIFDNNTKDAVKVVATHYSSQPFSSDIKDSIAFKSNKFINSGKIYFNLYNRHGLLFSENEIRGGMGNDDNCLLEVNARGNRKYEGRQILISGNTFTNITGQCVVYFENINYEVDGLFEYNRLFDNFVKQSVLILNSEFYNITLNRFYNPDVTYDLFVIRKGDDVVNGTRNWWGSADLNRAKLRIFDKRQQTDLLKVNIEPILTEEEFDCSDVNNCTDRGECVRPNGCRCNSGWTGQSCSDFDCAGVNGCYGNGVCIGPNTCQCNTGWTGSFCTVATCFNVNNCSNRGVCVLPEQCLCLKRFAGADCSSCSVDRWGTSCHPCPACVNGICNTQNGRCVCDSMNWAGALCDRCNDTFYGPLCLPYVNVLNIIPTTGIDSGNTLVHIWGHNFPETTNNTYFCRFGSLTVQGQRISREHVTCISPKQTEGRVYVEISPDGITFTNNKTEFTYYATCPPSACGRDLEPPRGQCLYGNCVCIKPYVGQDCTIELLKPVIIPIGKEYLSIREGYFWSIQLNVTRGSKPLQWRLSNRPPGLEIDQESGLLEWGPTVASSSPYVVTITVSNFIGQDSVTIKLQAIYSYNVTVTDIQKLPASDSVTSQSLGSPTPIKVSGHINIFDRSSWNDRLASIDVKIKNKQNTKILYAYTDPLNKEYFETTYYPRPDDSGRFSVDATHPSDKTFSEQAYWSVLGMKTDPPSVYKTAYLDTNTVIFRNIGKLINTGVDTINNINAAIEGIGGPLTCGSVSFTGQTQDNMLISLAQNQQVTFDLTVNATGPLRGTIAITFSTTLGTTTTMRVQITLNIRTPLLTLSPSSFSGSVVRGTQKTLEMEITNQGEVTAEEVTLAMPSDNRISVLSFSVNGTATSSDKLTIKANETAILSIAVTTSSGESLGEMNGRIGLNTRTTAKYIYYHFYITSIQIMNLTVRVEDEYTYFAPGKPLLGGATVRLSNPRRKYSVELITTNDTGVVFSDIYEDRYNLYVFAPSHSSYQAVIITQFDQNTTTVFLQRIAVQYTWTVTPTTIEDKYVITLDSTFETEVPMPVVTIDPAKVNTIPYEEGREDQIDFVITNHGLIRADNLRFSLPNHPYLIFNQTVPNIGSLAANSSIVVPVSVSLKPRARRNAAALAICGLMLLYDYDCGGPRTRGQDVTLTRETPGRPPMPCGIGGSGGGTSGGPYTGVSGIGGGSVTGSGSAMTYNPVTPLSCNCAKTLITSCTLAFHPIVGCAYATADLVLKSNSFFGFLENALNFAFSCIIGVFCTLCGYAWTIIGCIKGISEDCDSAGRTRRDVSSALIDQMLDAASPMDNYLSILTEVFGDDRIHNIDEYEWYQSFKTKISDNSENGVALTSAEVTQILATVNQTANKDIVQRFLQRWNNTASAWNNGTLGSADVSQNIMSKTNLDPKFEKFTSDTETAKKKGFESIFDYFDHSLNTYKKNEKEQTSKDDGVCAKVRVRIVQELVLTRDAFNAKLEIENGEESDLEDIKVTIEIRQTYGSGDSALQHFSIGEAKLVGITGVDGSGRLRRSISGTAEWLIVPYSTAAPRDDTLYDVGGRLTYKVGGSNFSLVLLPDTITVKPNPTLVVHYFHEKYVQGDDPMTQSVVEPIVPFSLAVMVANTGYGVARSMKITSAQPEIIENEKGLLITFKIIGAQLGNDPITPSLTVTFGDIDPFHTKNARWLLTSTLKGTFYNYTATFENINPLGDPQLSLLDELGYHELLHLVRIEDTNDDGLDDYLVNDIIDETDMPDRLYDSSNGTTFYNVSVGNVTVFKEAKRELRGNKEYRYIQLQISVNDSGWFYVRTVNNITRPGQLSGPKLLSVTKMVGNQENKTILVRKNAWLTTHINDEYYFHLLDKHLPSENTSLAYKLIFGPVNMYSPKFTKEAYDVYLNIGVPMGFVIVNASATDIDGNTITYHIHENKSQFSINPILGEIKLIQALSDLGRISFNISAVDDGIPSKAAIALVNIHVIGANQSTPSTTTSPTTEGITHSKSTISNVTSGTTTETTAESVMSTVISRTTGSETITTERIRTTSEQYTRSQDFTTPKEVSTSIMSSTTETETFSSTDYVNTTQSVVTTRKVSTPSTTENQTQLQIWHIAVIIVVVVLLLVLIVVSVVTIYRKRHGFGSNKYRLELIGMS